MFRKLETEVKQLQKNQNGLLHSRMKKKKLLSRQEILDEHNRLLELQFQKLRLVLQQINDETNLRKIADSNG